MKEGQDEKDETLERIIKDIEEFKKLELDDE